MIPRFNRLVAVLAALALAACGSSGGDAPGGSLIKSQKPRLSAASVPAADVAEQAQGNEAFAFDLYAQLRGQSGNLFYSPYSISSALAMLWAGAAGQTATDVAGALHFDMPADRVHGAFNALDQALASRAQAGTSVDDGPFRLNVANAIWAQRGMTLQPDFLDTLAQNYGAGVRVEPFQTAPETARGDINDWVSDQTAGLIPELLHAGDVDSSTRVVLTNAVYFNGAWGSQFDASQTHDGDFHHADGSTSQVPLMHQGLLASYAAGDGWKLVELPYSNPDLTLTVLVPDEGQLENVESQLTPAFFDAAVASEQSYDVVLALPKFQATTRASLAAPLTALGMGAAFGEQADFSGVDGQRDLALSDVVHEATVTVDEAGTQAAAATAPILGGTSAIQTVTLTIDRPFLVVLRDLPTGAVLFVGRISEP